MVFGIAIIWIRGELVHFEILVEDQSGQKALEILIPKIIGANHTYKIHAYKGIGKIPKGMKTVKDPSKRIFLDQLPRLLKAYGNYFHTTNYKAVVFVVCDLDDKCLKTFKRELLKVLNSCNKKPETRFCFAIEEGEAWFLGDKQAVKKAYPRAKMTVLDGYVQDSICGTWEKLADAVYNGGSAALKKKGFFEIGKEKSDWATSITRHMNVNSNESCSFCYFRDKLLECIP